MAQHEADVVIGAEVDESFDKAANEVEDRLGGLGDSMKNMPSPSAHSYKSVMSGINSSIDGVRRQREEMRGGMVDAVALGASIYAFLKPAAAFEQMQNRIGDATNATAEDMAALTELAKEQGRTTSFSAVQSAEAIEMLAKNGVATSDILGGALTGSMQLAAATGADLSMAADLATDVMANFGKGASELGGVNDGLVGTLKASKFGIDDYRLAIAQAGGVAGSLGVSLEDFNTTMAATSSLFASGSDAGTSFKTFLQRLVPASSEAAAMMQRYGLNFFDAQGNMKSMAGIAEELRVGLGDLSDEDLNDAMSTIFGTDAMRTAVGLMNRGAEGMEAARQQVEAAGDAEAAAAARMKGLTGALTRMKSATEGVAVSVGTVLLPALADTIDTITPLIGEVVKFAEANPMVTKAVVGTVVALAALKVSAFATGYAWTFIKEGALQSAKAMTFLYGTATGQSWGAIAGRIAPLGGAIMKVGAAFRAASMAIIANPIGIAVAGAALLIYKYWEPITAFLSGVWAGMSNVLSEIGDGFSRGFAPIKEVLEPLQPVFDMLGSALGTVVTWFKELFVPVTQTDEAFANTFNTGMAFGEFLGKTLGAAIETALVPLNLMVFGLTSLYEATVGVLTFFSEMPSKISDFIGSVVDTFKADGFKAAGIAAITGMWDGMKETFWKVADWLTSKIAALTDLMPDWVADAMGIERQQRVLSEVEIDQRVSEGLEDFDAPEFNERRARNRAEGKAEMIYEDDTTNWLGLSAASDEVQAAREAYVAAEVANERRLHEKRMAAAREQEEARIRDGLLAQNAEIEASRREQLGAVIGDTIADGGTKESAPAPSTMPAPVPTSQPIVVSVDALGIKSGIAPGTAPETSLRPQARPGGEAEAAIAEGAAMIDSAVAQTVALEQARAAALAAERPRSVTMTVQAPITVNNYGPPDEAGQAVRRGVAAGANDILAEERDQYVD